MTAEIGAPAPTFAAPTDGEGKADLAALKGRKVVLYFYPKDDTPECTTEACNFRDNIFQFRAIDAAVVGISVDDVESHKAFSDKYELPFTLLADTEGSVCSDYGVLRDFGVGKLASRQSFLVNPDGVIAKHYADVNPDTHTQEVLADIQAMRGDG